MINLKEYISANLNEEQSNAALSADTSSLILAWAWSGKTRVLTYKIAYLIFGIGVKPESILAVTFTNKAAKEMKERLESIARDIVQANTSEQWTDSMPWESSDSPTEGKKIETPLLTAQSFQWIGTFHSMFLKILKYDLAKTDFGYTKDFVIYDENESSAVVKQCIKELKMEDDIELREVKSVISKFKNQWILASSVMKKADTGYEKTAGMIYEKYEKKLKTNNAMDFDDLLLYAYKMLSEYPDILAYWQKKFQYILVDEAQDTNRIQFELLKLLTKKWSNITFIWDDYQSIYRRRGAMMENFLQVKKLWPDIEIFKLQMNYRSRPHIVQAGNFIIKNNKKQYDKNVVAHREGNDRIMTFTHTTESEEAGNTIKLIQKFIVDKKKSRKDVAILYRTNAQSVPFEQLLLQEGIPYKIYGWFKFFERKEIKDILSYLKFFMNPRDSLSCKRIINTPKRKIWQDTVEKIEMYASENDISLYDATLIVTKNNLAKSGGDVHLEEWFTMDIDTSKSLTNNLPQLWPQTQAAIKWFVTTMQFLAQSLATTPPSKFISQIVTTIRYKDYLIEQEWKDVGIEKYENIGQLINLTEKFDEPVLAGLMDGKEALAKLLDEVALLTDLEETTGGQNDAVQLMTIHASKWLEFPIVFVVGLEEGIFPLSSATYEEDAMEEERRLMYVAITRAKDHIFLSCANARRQRWQQKYNEPSRFLDELPEELVKHFDFTGAGSNEYTWIYVGPTFSEWDQIYHKLFGVGEIVEVRNNMVVVRFWNPKYGLRKMDAKFLQKR